jgi:hypothetical protein
MNNTKAGRMSGSSGKLPVITLVISDLFHARSAFETRLIEPLKESFDLVIICTTEVYEKYEKTLEHYECHISHINPWGENLSNRIMNAGAFRFRSVSSSFRYRIKRRIIESEKFNHWRISPIFVQKLSRFIIWSKLFIDGQILYRSYLIPRYRKFLESNSNLREILQEVQPDAIVIWSQSMEPSSSSAVRISRQLKIPSILVADNWDNLFSKTVLIEKPDLVGCFGMQGVNFGAKLHDIPIENVIPLGSARFEIYRDQNIVFEHRDIVLYAGSSIVSEDERVLRTMLKVKNNLDKATSSALVWRYRPHPFPQKSSSDLAGILGEFTDLHIESVKGLEKCPPSWPKLIDSVDELARTRIAVCMPTSYLLEVRINGVEVIVPAFEDNLGVTSCKTLLSSLEHLKGIHNISGVTVASSEAEIESSLLKGITDPSFPPPDQTLDWFVQWSGAGFGPNLAAAVCRVIR